MKIGLIGVGSIGKSLALSLPAAGHNVKVSNSRGPDSIEPDVLATGAEAVELSDAVHEVDVVILSIPMNRIPQIAPLLARADHRTVVVDTSNYYPSRDETNDAVEAGQVESAWVQEQLGRPVAKAWNAIGSASLATNGTAPGTEGRIALPVAADDDGHRAIAMQLVEDSGFDAVDAGTIAESWRQQPGNPAYCTDLTRAELPDALAAADAGRAPRRRDLVVAAIMDRYEDPTRNPDAEWSRRLARVIFM